MTKYNNDQNKETAEVHRIKDNKSMCDLSSKTKTMKFTFSCVMGTKKWDLTNHI